MGQNLFKIDGECCACLKLKPLLYKSIYQVPGGPVEAFECSPCRMAVNYLNHPMVTPDYIWDHLLTVRREIK